VLGNEDPFVESRVYDGEVYLVNFETKSFEIEGGNILFVTI